MDYVAELKAFTKKHEFFVGIDSDGCVFDTMEIKHKECFCPAFVKVYGPQAASKYVREVWEFVNLYSRSRGVNRFVAVQIAHKLMGEWPVFAERGLKIKSLPALDAWLKEESKLGNATLEAKVKATGDPELAKALAWSKEVNQRVDDLVHEASVFPWVRQSLGKIHPQADVLVVSQTPVARLRSEWKELKLDPYVNHIAGQEAGTKTEHIKFAATGRYASDNILMIGDAWGDLEAATGNHALFFPIVPGKEEASWKRFFDEGACKFFGGAYAGAYQRQLLGEFEAALPEKAPWHLSSSINRARQGRPIITHGGAHRQHLGH